MSNTTGVEALTTQTRDQAATATTLQDQPMSTRAGVAGAPETYRSVDKY